MAKRPLCSPVDNAKAYFDPSTLIKETKKTATTMLMKLPRMKKLFADFLRHHPMVVNLTPKDRDRNLEN